jgi:hypothetical protein
MESPDSIGVGHWELGQVSADNLILRIRKILSIPIDFVRATGLKYLSDNIFDRWVGNT